MSISSWAHERSPARPKEESTSRGHRRLPMSRRRCGNRVTRRRSRYFLSETCRALPENDFYGFSLADSVITELAQLHDLVVRPSSYVAQYQNKDVDPRAIGIQLAVDAVLIGGYLKAGDRLQT